MADAERMQLVLEFDTDDAEFARGFEVGCLYARLKMQPDALEAVCHASNQTMLMRIGAANRYDVAFEDLGDGWYQVLFTPSKTILTLV